MTASEFNSKFQRARQLHAQGLLAQAEPEYRQLAAHGEHREAVLEALLELYLQSRRAAEAVETLVLLTQEQPDKLQHHARLASLLDSLGRTGEAIDHYRRLIERQPALAAAHFNLALLYKKSKRYADAIAAYERAVQLGIDNVQEVHSNMGVLYSEMRDATKAAQMYERALAIDPDYIPALFNRAGLFEEAGERQPAIELYRRILALDPRHWDSLARLAHVRRVTSADEQLVASLQAAVSDAHADPLAREGLYFALGKALDDLGRYQQAADAYRSANELGRLRNPPYDRRMVERAIDELIEVFEPHWMKRAGTPSTAAPVFICGMFRSGSTLVEQILAAHPAISAGGELDYLPWLALRELAPYPKGVRRASTDKLRVLGEKYLSAVRQLFPEAQVITDKRPDNFLHLGLVKILFPRARVIYTRRNPLDNCLSIYFQQLGGNLNYATDLDNTAHYYVQHQRLMQHWLDCFGADIFTLDYDELVRAPEPLLRRLMEFLGLPWDERCLAFDRTASLVKTASVWQVREPLHPLSSGRWRNYEGLVRGIQTCVESP